MYALLQVPSSEYDMALEQCRNRSGEMQPPWSGNGTTSRNVTDFMLQDKTHGGNLDIGGDKQQPVTEGSYDKEEEQDIAADTGSGEGDKQLTTSKIIAPLPTDSTSVKTTKTASTKAKTTHRESSQSSIPTTTTTSTTTPTTITTTTITTTTTVPTTHPVRIQEEHQDFFGNLDDVTRKIFVDLGYSEDDIDDIDKMDKSDFQNFMNEVEKMLADSVASKESARHRRDILGNTLSSINEKLSQWQSTMSQMQYRAFISVLVVILTAELFSAPTEKLADTLWFEFLDGLDFLERYGSQRVWSTLAMIIFPLVRTAVK